MKKILIADSGSTKTDWVSMAITDGSHIESETFTSRGLNPHLLSYAEINSEMLQAADMLGRSYDRILFFGAGVGISEMRRQMLDCLNRIFECESVRVGSDMEGAAYAVLGKESGIACIMGTGSNSCHFKGTNIDRKPASLGYILDDNGGGVAFGKRFVADIFKGIAPPDITDAFHRHYDLKVSDVLTNLYHKPAANRWLAGFMPFIAENRDNEYVASLIESQLAYFFDREFAIYSRYELEEEGIGFVGSVAKVLETEIRMEMQKRGWKTREIIGKPLDSPAKLAMII